MHDLYILVIVKCIIYLYFVSCYFIYYLTLENKCLFQFLMCYLQQSILKAVHKGLSLAYFIRNLSCLLRLPEEDNY